MLFLIAIGALVTGTITGICLHQFHQNGWVPYKYLQHDKAGKNLSKSEINISPVKQSSNHRKRVYKAFAF